MTLMDISAIGFVLLLTAAAIFFGSWLACAIYGISVKKAWKSLIKRLKESLK